MQNKIFLSRLRVFIAAGSLGGFVGGWALLAQAGKSTVSESPTPTPALVGFTTTPSPTTLIVATQAATSVAQPTATATRATQVEPTATRTATPKLKTGGS